MENNNFKKIGYGIYIVRTQAGFKKAIKDFGYTYVHLSDEVRGYPKKYPSVCFLSEGYEGYFYTLARCITINELKKEIENE